VLAFKFLKQYIMNVNSLWGILEEPRTMEDRGEERDWFPDDRLISKRVSRGDRLGKKFVFERTTRGGKGGGEGERGESKGKKHRQF